MKWRRNARSYKGGQMAVCIYKNVEKRGWRKVDASTYILFQLPLTPSKSNLHLLEIHTETTSILYTPIYIFNDSETDWNVNFILHGASHHLRQAEIRYSDRHFLWYYGPRYERSALDLPMINALAIAAINLERLEISFAREFTIYST